MKLDFSSERSFQARFAKDLQNLSNTSKISITLHKFRKVDDALPNASHESAKTDNSDNITKAHEVRDFAL